MERRRPGPRHSHGKTAMFAYNIGIALRSLRRNPLLTAVIVGGIALGICASTTFTTVRHMYARDPLPGRSDRLFYVRMDNWDPSSPYPFAAGDGWRSPTQISYGDAVGLMQRASIPVRQTASFQTARTVYPESKTLRPYSTSVRAVGS